MWNHARVAASEFDGMSDAHALSVGVNHSQIQRLFEHALLCDGDDHVATRPNANLDRDAAALERERIRK